MSIALVLAPILFLATIVVCVLVGRAVVRYARKAGVGPVGVAVSVVISAGLLTLCWYVVRDLFTADYGFNVTPEAANNVALPKLRVPVLAFDVSYRYGLDGTRYLVEFQIDEAGFLSWVGTRGWEVDKFVTDERDETGWADPAQPLPKYSGLGFSEKGTPPPFRVEVTPVISFYEGTFDRKRIRNGYYFDDFDVGTFDDDGYTVIYDLDEGRVYAWCDWF